MPLVDGSTITTLEPIPADTYEAVLSSIELKEGKKDKYYSCIFVISSGEFEDRKLWRNASIAPQSLWNFKEMCMALGEPEATFEGEFDTDDVLDGLLGNPCRIDVELGEYDHKPKNDIKKVRAPGFE